MKHKSVIRSLIAGCAVLGTSLCLASSPSYYAGAGIGYNQYNTSKTTSSTGVKTNNLAYGIFVGTLWDVKPLQLGLDLSGYRFGKKKWDTAQKGFSLRSQLIGLNIVARYCTPTTTPFFIEAQVGGSYVWQKTTFSEKQSTPVLPGPNISGSSSALKPDVGAGIGVILFKRLATSVNYMHVFANRTKAPIKDDASGSFATTSEFNKIASLSTYTVKLAWQF